ncbi:hypothetical protein [Sporolactobacillus nakayamae]|uniref:DUF2933 domain-containing protein n=1 Tax=Sporolactobacillus nakayamae TaxID=269670 RepID=A0A1I2WH92_9BACL|nr:hypothetical protein [Sporolactobacillus nakayamae]SFG98941.1 hypothetical protein SAMN02982927_03498 [Sporolactobacillus nakayamae]
MDWSWLALLACPLMMLPMMLMMMRGGHSEKDHSGHHNAPGEVNALKEQNKLLQEEIQQLKNK